MDFVCNKLNDNDDEYAKPQEDIALMSVPRSKNPISTPIRTRPTWRLSKKNKNMARF